MKGEEDKADRGRGGKTTSGNGQAWSPATYSVPEGSGEQGKKEKTGCKIICVGMTLAVKGLMMINDDDDRLEQMPVDLG